MVLMEAFLHRLLIVSIFDPISYLSNLPRGEADTAVQTRADRAASVILLSSVSDPQLLGGHLPVPRAQ